MEYVGEVTYQSTYEERVKSIYADDKHTYAVALGDQLIIDAHREGNICRYVNHSCDPNCNMERWIVNGLPCLGLFSKREIQKGEELTFDYRLHLFNFDENPKCKCGSENCQGLLAKPKNTSNRKPETKKETSKRKCVKSPAFEVIDLTEMDDPTVITSSTPLLDRNRMGEKVGVEVGIENNDLHRPGPKDSRTAKRKHTNQEYHDGRTESVPVKRTRITYANSCFDSSGVYNVLPLKKCSAKEGNSQHHSNADAFQAPKKHTNTSQRTCSNGRTNIRKTNK